MKLIDQLKQMTVVVADTGDIEAIRQHKPRDATTNPSLIYKAAQMPEYEGLVQKAISFAKSKAQNAAGRVEACRDRLAVDFGVEILKETVTLRSAQGERRTVSLEELKHEVSATAATTPT